MLITVYGKPDCPLCDECKAELQSLRLEFGLVLEERNILDDPALFTRFRHLIPVVDVPGGPLLYPPHDRSSLRSALQAVQEESVRGGPAG